MRLAAPSMLVDINGLPDLDRRPRPPTDGVRVGALARHADVLGRSPTRRGCSRWSRWRWPTSRTRRSATGARRSARSCTPTRPPRCRWCCGCSAAPSTWRRRRGRRTIAADDLFAGPLESTLAPRRDRRRGVLPGARRRARAWRSTEIARRHGDYALCGVAALVAGDGDRVTSARAGYLSVSDVPTVVDLTDALADGSPSRAGERRRHRTRRARPGRRHPRHRRLPRPAGARAAPARVASLGRQGVTIPQLRDGGRMSEELHDVRLHVNGAPHDVRVPAAPAALRRAAPRPAA